jgi:hypothetical protein
MVAALAVGLPADSTCRPCCGWRWPPVRSTSRAAVWVQDSEATSSGLPERTGSAARRNAVPLRVPERTRPVERRRDQVAD